MSDGKVDVYMPLYIGDYLADTSDLSAEEHGAYLLILMAMWRARARLPLARLDRVAKVARGRWDDVWAVIGRFFETVDGFIVQHRLMRELEAALEKKRRASDRGRKGGLARAQAQADREHDSSSAQGQEDSKPARVTVTDLPPSELPIGLSPDPSRQASQDHATHARDPSLWRGPDWETQFGRAWCEKYQRLAMGGSVAGSKATGALTDQLDELPRSERLAAQARAAEMFAEFLGSDEPSLVTNRHPWAWFVTRFHGLRVPRAPAARARAAPAKSDGNLEVIGAWLEKGVVTG